MSKSRKLFVLLLISAAALTIIFFQLFNTLAESNRAQVHEELQKLLGKDATFDGLEASFWGGLGFSAKEFRVADNPRFAATPIVRAKEMKLGVSLIPLLLGRVVINSLTFQSPEFQIITDERGLLNLSELAIQKREPGAGARSRATSPERKTPSVSFLITQITVKNGRVDFIDRSVKEPAEIRVNNVQMDITGIRTSERINVSLAAALTEGLGHDVKIHGQVGPLRRDHDWSQQPLELEMRFDSLSIVLLSRALPFLRNRIPRELEVTGPLSLQAKLEGTLHRLRITGVDLRVPLFGSSSYNAVVLGTLEVPEGASWAEAQLKGKLTLYSINLAQLRNLPVFKENLPAALTTEGSMNAYSQFEGTWANLRIGALIKAEKGEFRYQDWFRKPAGSAAELRAQISRHKNGLILHESRLSLGNSRMTLSGTTEETPAPRLQLRLRSDSNDLSGWGHLVSSRAFYGAGGDIHWDIVLGKNLALPDGWSIRGKLKLAGAEFKNKDSGRKIDHLRADVSFLGTEALLENGSFRLGSSSMTVAAKVRDLSKLRATYGLQSPELHLVDLPGFPSGKPSQMRNVAANGEVEWRDGTPLLEATVVSSDGSLENIPYHGLHGRMTWSPAGLRFQDLSFRAFDGLLRSDGSWHATAAQPPRFTVTSEIESIALESLVKQEFPALQNRIEGRLDFRGRFDATPNNGLSGAAALHAVGAAVIHHGIIRDFNLMGSIIPLTGDTASSKTLPRLPASLVTALNRQHTAFDTLKANFTVERQRIRTENFLLITPDYTITGSGWIGFDRTTQWHGLMVLSPGITQELQREYKMIRYLLDRRGRLTISFRAEGKFPTIKVSPENRHLAQVLGRGSSAKTLEKQEKPWLPETLEQLLKP